MIVVSIGWFLPRAGVNEILILLHTGSKNVSEVNETAAT